MRVGHVMDGNLLLEKPGAVKPFHAVLRDPSFSPMGVILLSASFPFIPVHSLVLFYRVIRAADITLHLYLIPNNHGLEKAVDKDEKRRGHSFLVDKPPHTSRPLKFNTWYHVSSSSKAEINPQVGAEIRLPDVGQPSALHRDLHQRPAGGNAAHLDKVIPERQNGAQPSLGHLPESKRHRVTSCPFHILVHRFAHP
ncbi:NACHT, LRR and PYD domains-containing protein 1b allele 2-like isoform X2 [Numida meleagris]|uniref:NACHT, LRR and PYD domains-containing protein 1b allele 2-like isoform X2 n=1 Tax=Numida meleagris TaxID=8996 RepID=UPI000B3DC24B|nr:NACHT, LRR and PYD domains-containing protein 1b allele 2-like isoform X2 [Numida meleagris]